MQDVTLIYRTSMDPPHPRKNKYFMVKMCNRPPNNKYFTVVPCHCPPPRWNSPAGATGADGAGAGAGSAGEEAGGAGAGGQGEQRR